MKNPNTARNPAFFIGCGPHTPRGPQGEGRLSQFPLLCALKASSCQPHEAHADKTEQRGTRDGDGSDKGGVEIVARIRSTTRGGFIELNHIPNVAQGTEIDTGTERKSQCGLGPSCQCCPTGTFIIGGPHWVYIQLVFPELLVVIRNRQNKAIVCAGKSLSTVKAYIY